MAFISLVKSLKTTKKLFIIGVIFLAIFSFFVFNSDESDDNSAYIDESKRLSIVVGQMEFGAKYKTPYVNTWHYLNKGFLIRQGYEFKGSKNLMIKAFDGRKIEVSEDAHGKISKITLNQIVLELYQGSVFIKPWSRSLQKISLKVGKDSFPVKTKEDYLQIKAKNNSVVDYSYKVNGVLLTKTAEN